MATSQMSTYELETLFIEKLTEKYSLTERSIKKAFARFDSDGNGLLNLSEMTAGFDIFLTGVKPAQIEALVSSYDVNGDGTISFEEFFHFLTNRKSKPKTGGGGARSFSNNAMGGNRSQGRERGGSSLRDKYESYEESTLDNDDNDHISGSDDYSYLTDELSDISLLKDKKKNTSRSYYASEEEETRSELSSARSEMSSVFDPGISGAIDSRVTIFIDGLKAHLLRESMKMRRENKVTNSHQIHARELGDNVSRTLLTRAFQREANSSASSSRSGDLVSLKSFCNVLKSFPLPGLPNIRMEVFKVLFAMCSDPSEPSLASPTTFMDFLFNSSSSGANQRTNTMNGNIDRQAPRRNSRPGQGPVRGISGDEEGLPNKTSQLPTRYTCSKSRTTYITPTHFDETVLRASAAPPACRVARNHVYGLRLADLYSGQAIHCLHGGGQGSREKDQGHVIVYAASSLGVVHDLVSNKQLFFDKHDDELTCITVDASCGYVATGQLGKRPSLYLWNARTAEYVKEIGRGYFARAVCAASFSHDTKYLCAVSCDDKHSMGVWDVHSGELVCETTLCNGIPPMIKFVVFAPELQFTSYINSQHDGLNYAFVTSGERHMKFWSFKSPKNGSSALLASKGATMGDQKQRTQPTKSLVEGAGGKASVSASVDQAKIYHCSAYLFRSGPGPGGGASSAGNGYDVVSGGDNGYLYLWVEGVCIRTARASRGAIRCIKVVGENIFCGCLEGNVKMFDKNLQRIAEYSAVLDADSHLPSSRPSTASSISSSGSNAKVGGVAHAKIQSARRVSRLAQQSSSAATGSKSSRPSTPKKIVGKVENRPGSAPTTYSQAPSNAVMSLDMDFSPYFYSGGRGGTSGETLVVATAAGCCVRLHIDAPSETPPSNLFSFHTGALWALSGTGSLGTLFVTGGEDRYLSVWSFDSRSLVCRRRVQASPRCCCLDKSNKFIAVGMSRGMIAIYYFDYRADASSKSSGRSSISDVLVSRQDNSEAISDVKFNPSSNKLASGSHDNMIDIYEVTLSAPRNSSDVPTAQLHPFKRLRGHSSYITHFDWSLDGRLIQSMCGAYEILYWDVEVGKQFSCPNPSDLQWKTYTCTLGFGVMGIWPPYADGTDINSLHVSRDKSLVVTGDDSGLVNVFNYPCVVKNAPRVSLNGHSAHVTNVRFAYDDSMIVSVGGRDNCAISWLVTKTKLKNPAPPESGWV